MQGDEAEDELIDYFGSMIAKKNKSYEDRSLYDVEVDLSYDSHGMAKLLGFRLTFEVKNDIMSKRTGNVAIEYYNSKSNKPSGIMITEATFWAHKIDEDIWIVPVYKLKEFVTTQKPVRIINGGGDDNADLMLYRIEHFTSICTKLKDHKHVHEILNLLDSSIFDFSSGSRN